VFADDFSRVSNAVQLRLDNEPSWRARDRARLERRGGLSSEVDALEQLLAAARLVMEHRDVFVGRAVVFAAEQVAATRRLNDLSHSRIVPMWRRFDGFARAHGIERLEDVTPDLARRWVTAPTGTGGKPSVATQHLRRSALRLLFAVLRDAGLMIGDPTLDLKLPRRALSAWRPLTDDEIELCEWNALGLDGLVRRSVTLALAESALTTTEIALVRSSDVDLEQHVVNCSGSDRRAPRRAPLSRWATQQLRRHLPASSADTFVARVGGDLDSRRTSVINDLNLILRRAHLSAEGDVRIDSIAAWAAQCVLVETGRIESVARFLGLSSLDAAARFVGYDWRAQDG
jgi:site-specific recombinase XerC